MRIARLFSFCLLVACSSQRGDPPSPPTIPDPAGKADRIYDIADPESPKKAAHQTQVSVSGAVVIAVDTFDETKNGRSAGTIYVADLGSLEPYSGLSLFQPSFIPGNLRVAAGDTLDLRGEYQENNTVPIQFAPGAFLAQLSTPIATIRYDASVPIVARDIDIRELQNFDTGRKWLNMLVRVRNVTLERDAFDDDPSPTASGRISSQLLPPEENEATQSGRACEAPFPKAPTLVNELMDLTELRLAKGETLKELVGVVTFFCNLHIAPRSAADIVR